MKDIETILETEFVKLIIAGEISTIHEAFHAFAAKLIGFIHKPHHWVYKHICLIQLNSIFRAHVVERVECHVTSTYVSLAVSLVATMKDLLVEAQKNSIDTLVSFREAINCANGSPLVWTDNVSNLYELIQALYAKEVFNNGDASIADITGFFAAVLDIELSVDACHENCRQMRRRKGKKDAQPYDVKRNIYSRTYFLDDCRSRLNDKWIRQDDVGDGRGVK